MKMRKSIIVVLSLGAVGTAIAWLLSLLGEVGYFGVAGGANLGGGGIIILLGPPPGHAILGGHWLPSESNLVWFPCVIRNSGTVSLVFPFWLVFIAVSAYPTIAFARRPLRRRYRRRRGLCIRCGYNLEGNVSGVCPECGTEYPKASNAN
ncbi:MAG: hypothetical protein IID42_01850 [Planctomycetes bacterium]|nr:hypothetical protein [Planctomycetota bacterium]